MLRNAMQAESRFLSAISIETSCARESMTGGEALRALFEIPDCFRLFPLAAQCQAEQILSTSIPRTFLQVCLKGRPRFDEILFSEVARAKQQIKNRFFHPFSQQGLHIIYCRLEIAGAQVEFSQPNPGIVEVGIKADYFLEGRPGIGDIRLLQIGKTHGLQRQLGTRVDSQGLLKVMESFSRFFSGAVYLPPQYKGIDIIGILLQNRVEQFGRSVEVFFGKCYSCQIERYGQKIG